jgi:hypothetical protein
MKMPWHTSFVYQQLVQAKVGMTLPALKDIDVLVLILLHAYWRLHKLSLDIYQDQTGLLY